MLHNSSIINTVYINFKNYYTAQWPRDRVQSGTWDWNWDRVRDRNWAGAPDRGRDRGERVMNA